MIYNFLLLSDEDEMFLREIAIDGDKTFFDLHEAILDCVKFDKNQMTSFFLCNDDWEKEQEITLMEMDTSSEYDNLIMHETVLSDTLPDEGQKLLYVFDYLSERAFFIRLEEIVPGKNLEKAKCVRSEGKAPVQVSMEDEVTNLLKNDDFSGEFFGDEEFDLDEIDEEGFGDISFNDADAGLDEY